MPGSPSTLSICKLLRAHAGTCQQMLLCASTSVHVQAYVSEGIGSVPVLYGLSSGPRPLFGLVLSFHLPCFYCFFAQVAEKY